MAERRGFTLVEITMVLVVLGIAATIAAPRLHAWIVHMRTRAAANRVASALAYTRALAVREGWQARLVIEPSPDCPAPAAGAAGHRFLIERVDADRPASRVDLRAQGGRICLIGNRSDAVTYDSRGLLVGHNNRTLIVREGDFPADTLTLSAVGRVYRKF